MITETTISSVSDCFGSLSPWPALRPSVFASCRASSSVSVGRREPRPQCHLVFWVSVFSRSLDQFFIGEPLSGNTVDEAVKPREGMVLYVAFIEPKRELINVTIKVLWAGVVIDADQAALHNREDTLDPVRGHVVADKFASAVIDRFVVEGKSLDAVVGTGLIRIEHGAGLDHLTDRALDGFFVCAATRWARSASSI